MSLYTIKDVQLKIAKLPSHIQKLFKVNTLVYFERIYWLEHFLLHTGHWDTSKYSVRYTHLV